MDRIKKTLGVQPDAEEQGIVAEGTILLWRNLKMFAVFYTLGNVTSLARYQ
eukprot:gene17268-8832_t